MELSNEKLNAIFYEHLLWMNKTGGQRANLSGKNLKGLDLRDVRLVEANLCGINFRGACLRDAHFQGAKLQLAQFQGADLRGGNFRGSDLMGACLQGADARGADFKESKLQETELRGVHLEGADLQMTVLSPHNKPNGLVSAFEEFEPGWVLGYRTRATSAPGRGLVDDVYYSSEPFSTCDHSDCHPGWYLWPSLDQARDFSGKCELVKVKARSKDVHHIKDRIIRNRWRSKMIYVIGSNG